jgi:hypothetical protein
MEVKIHAFQKSVIIADEMLSSSSSHGRRGGGGAENLLINLCLSRFMNVFSECPRVLRIEK